MKNDKFDRSDYQFNSQNKRNLAEEQIKNDLSVNHNDPDLLHRLALIYYDRKDYQSAMELCSKILKSDKNYIEAYWSLVFMNREIRDFNKSEQYLQKLEKILDVNCLWTVCVERALNLLAQKKYDKSIEVIRNTIDSTGGITDLYINLGRVYLEKNEFHLALEQFEQAEQHDKSAHNLAYNLTKTYMILNNYGKAEKYFNKINTLDLPLLYWEVNICRGLFDRDKERLPEIEDIYIKYNQNDLDNAELLYHLGCLKILTKDFDSAINNLKNSILIDKYCVKSQLLLSNYLRQESRRAELEKHLQSIEKLNIKTLDWVIHFHKALSYMHEKQFSKALVCIDSAIALFPENAVLHFYKSYFFLSLNDLESSVSYLEKTISLDCCFFRAHLNLAISYRTLGRHIDAINILNAIPEVIHPEIAKTRYFEKSLSYKEVNQVQLAKHELLKAAEIDDGTINQLETIGKQFEILKDHYHALICYAKLIEKEKKYCFE